MTETSGREKALEDALRRVKALVVGDALPNWPMPADGKTTATRCRIADIIDAALASPSTQKPALRGGKVEEIARTLLAWADALSSEHNREMSVEDIALANGGCITDDLREAAASLRTYAGESAAQSERAGLERAAAIAEKEADDAREQIEHNNEYARRSGSDGSAANEACRKTIYVAEKIAEEIRVLSAARKTGGE